MNVCLKLLRFLSIYKSGEEDHSWNFLEVHQLFSKRTTMSSNEENKKNDDLEGTADKGSIRFIDQDTITYSSSTPPLKLKAQPKGVAHENDLSAVATLESVHLIKNGSTVQEEKVDYEPSCVSISSDLQSLAVGDAGQGMYLIMIKKDALTKGSAKLQTSYFRARQRLEGMDNFAFFHSI